MDQQQFKVSKTKRFIKETIRVLRVLKRPDRTEFLGLCKVTGLGIAIVGVLGFVIFLFKQLLL